MGKEEYPSVQQAKCPFAGAEEDTEFQDGNEMAVMQSNQDPGQETAKSYSPETSKVPCAPWPRQAQAQPRCRARRSVHQRRTRESESPWNGLTGDVAEAAAA